MTCPSGKVRHYDRIAALMALASVRGKGERRPKDERRAYECPQCHGWHLTSQGRA
jgi:hypothetical protein